MEKLDIYDEHMNFLCAEDREIVHEKGFWHKTVHCWLYDREGNVYFQIRADSNKLYTSASGHVLAGETIAKAFHREVMEEIGVDVDTKNAQLVEITVWKQDRIKNGKNHSDRVFANVYINEINTDYHSFKFDENEVSGIVKVNASDCLDLLKTEDKNKEIEATKITNSEIQKVMIKFDDFTVFPNEIAIIKYGKILQSIISETK